MEHVHFIGIGGTGLSAIARLLLERGYTVSGSDRSDTPLGRDLVRAGVKVVVGHDVRNVAGADVVVRSSAVPDDNPEVLAAITAGIPVLKRAAFLGRLMQGQLSIAVAGTHGKTTTTSLVAAMLDAGGLDPTVINGGIINAYGTNARLGTGGWMVVETDESDGSFTKLPATICIVTNMDPEHLDHYKDFDAVRRAYDTFVENIPFYGFAVLCIDHPEVQAMVARIQDRKIVTYGFSPQADVRAVNIKTNPNGSTFDVHFTCRKTDQTTVMTDFQLPIIGLHNVQNVLSALAIGWQLGFTQETMCGALKKFEGVKRRFTRTGTANGITIVDDYAHHPVEIKATLKAAVQAKGENGRVIAVMQPHRYSRLSSLMAEFCTCFNDADCVIVADVYPAGEQPIEGASKDALVEGLRAHGHREVYALSDPKALAQTVSDIAAAGDYVICLGAGTISNWAHTLPTEMEALHPRKESA
ncbi:MAG TPA: UDP-N-acetylmuramate--L-alanine ligase [Rhodospirillaceae bacterium]|nr:UDP-N-acetylmuramate--L-alanine ligase [Rhodospirillaceae bacterium]